MSSPTIIIPARGGSKGIKDKNLQEIFGVPLVVRSILHATKVVNSKNIYISTDSELIIDTISKFFKFNYFKLKKNKINSFGEFNLHFRPKNLAQDKSLVTDLIHDIQMLLLKSNLNPITYAIFQPTSPFRSMKDLNLCKLIMDDNKDINYSAISVCLVGGMHPARMYKMKNNTHLVGLNQYNKFASKRRQDLPSLYIRDGGFYILGKSLVTKKLQFSKNPRSILREFPWSINIDNYEDLLLAQSIERNLVLEDPIEKGLT